MSGVPVAPASAVVRDRSGPRDGAQPRRGLSPQAWLALLGGLLGFVRRRSFGLGPEALLPLFTGSPFVRGQTGGAVRLSPVAVQAPLLACSGLPGLYLAALTFPIAIWHDPILR